MIYLGSPYSDPSEEMMEERYIAVSQVAHALLAEGLWIFCPIAHSHTLVKYARPEDGDINPTDQDFWARYNDWYMRHCHALAVLQLDGWDKSVGLTYEIGRFSEMGKEVSYLHPKTLMWRRMPWT